MAFWSVEDFHHKLKGGIHSVLPIFGSKSAGFWFTWMELSSLWTPRFRALFWPLFLGPVHPSKTRPKLQAKQPGPIWVLGIYTYNGGKVPGSSSRDLVNFGPTWVIFFFWASKVDKRWPFGNQSSSQGHDLKKLVGGCQPKNMGKPPNHPILIGVSIIFTIHFRDTTIFGNTQVL